jgi:hypothetical protein
VLKLLAFQGILNPLHDGIVAFAIIEDGVTFGAIYHRLDMSLRSASDAYKRVVVKLAGELQGLRSDS